MKATKIGFSLVLAALLAACGHAPPDRKPGEGIGLGRPPSASPGCDVDNVCRLYVSLETDAKGEPYVFVYPETLRISTTRRDVHVLWIILNDDVSFTDPKPIAIQKGDPSQWTDKYATDDDDGKPGVGPFRPKNFHGRFPKGAKQDTYKYAITVQRAGQKPVSRDPTIVNSD